MLYLWTNDNQFGFKSGHSTDLCIYALTECIEYFKSRSTSVYVAFLDASKAFDKISHWTLFKKLIDRHVPLYLVVILCYWYQHQEMTVRWGHCISNSFNVTNGVVHLLITSFSVTLIVTPKTVCFLFRYGTYCRVSLCS